jgi:hypothetical protein
MANGHDAGMGYISVTSACFGCGRVFSYNPMHVPSIRDPRTGSREPVCRDCVERVNPMRAQNGLPPIVPHPQAYEPCPEDEVDWG